MNDLERFEAWLREQDRSPVTVRGYLADLRAFATWFEQTNGRALRVRPPEEIEITLEEVAGWYVADLLFVPGADAVVVELLPPGAEGSEPTGILLDLDTNILLYLLYDQQIRKVEP